jgi:predicted dienelactone hydrolase
MQHAGSDESVWKDQPLGGRLKAMKEAANAENFMNRVADIPAVIDQLQKWNEQTGHALQGQLNLKQIGMSGHSFGAVTTQAVSGQSFLDTTRLTEPRIQAALAMSPSSGKNVKPEKAFGAVKIPWLLMTGTRDVSMIGDTDVESRLAVYPALPPGDKYELVLDQAEHSAFSERAPARDRSQRNPNHHKVILALSTAFWDAYLKEDAAAKAWLTGEGPRTVLEKADRWQHK